MAQTSVFENLRNLKLRVLSIFDVFLITKVLEALNRQLTTCHLKIHLFDDKLRLSQKITH